MQGIDFNLSSRQIGKGIRFLFDAHGNQPVNAPIEDIIAERRKAEVQIQWLEAICSELYNNLTKIKEFEEDAIALMAEVKAKRD